MESARSSNVKRFKGENDVIKEIKIRANLEELENARGFGESRLITSSSLSVAGQEWGKRYEVDSILNELKNAPFQ